MTAARPLLLVAASGLAREVLALSDGIPGIDVRGLVDDDPSTHGTEVHGRPVLGGLRTVLDHPDADLLLCAGSGTSRRVLFDRSVELGVGVDRWRTLVHPAAALAPDTRIGAGVIILPGVVATAGVVIEDHVVVMPNVTLTHDNRIGSYATLCAGVSLGGSVRIGSEAYIGMNASVRQNCTVGARSTLGMGAALLTDLPAGSTWFGVPARPSAPADALRQE